MTTWNLRMTDHKEGARVVFWARDCCRRGRLVTNLRLDFLASGWGEGEMEEREWGDGEVGGWIFNFLYGHEFYFLISSYIFLAQISRFGIFFPSTKLNGLPLQTLTTAQTSLVDIGNFRFSDTFFENLWKSTFLSISLTKLISIPFFENSIAVKIIRLAEFYWF